MKGIQSRRKEGIQSGNEGRKDGMMEGTKDGRRDGRMEGRKEGINIRKDRRTEGRNKRRKEGRKEGRKPLAGFHYISQFSWSRVSCRDFRVSEMLNSTQSNSSAHIQTHEGCRDESRRDVCHNVFLIILFLVAEFAPPTQAAAGEDAILNDDDGVSETSSDPGTSVLLAASPQEQALAMEEEASEAASFPRPSCPAYAELLEVMERAAGRLQLPWQREREETARGRLDERFLSGHNPVTPVSLPFLPDLHVEIEKAWKNPFSARIHTHQRNNFADVEGLRRHGRFLRGVKAGSAYSKDSDSNQQYDDKLLRDNQTISPDGEEGQSEDIMNCQYRERGALFGIACSHTYRIILAVHTGKKLQAALRLVAHRPKQAPH
ncbi:hypothetical protein DPX16_12878 [Anabarilius grahami]|uniref:Uncharacterized protein n=1 Tax=Anabarilius grahami TaxID=495550 RepID=A0A3N0XD72_ANAGA|nr:hypothetical protein DPX16_12878 [Anabarilius grahami]